jgi:hypothetical protein
MQRSSTLALGGALVALALTPAVALAAGPTTVSVRVEGLSRTLLPATGVKTHTGSITKGGTPTGTCPATSAAGALDRATGHSWNGSYSSGLGINITTILGETHKYSPNGYYWSIWVDNRYATAGICDLKLHRGEQVLFAPYPAKGTTAPIVISAPGHATAGHAFKAKAFYYNAKGVAKPLSGVSVKGAAGTTNKRGIVMVTPPRAEKLKLSASRKGYIRSATTTVTVGA